MTQEEKQLLLKDLCARLPYGVKCIEIGSPVFRLYTIVSIYKDNVQVETDEGGIIACDISAIKPYLRPMSSMTDEEREKFRYGFGSDLYGNIKRIDWLIANHFDYHGLIPMKLARKAKEGMYKTE